MHGAEITFSPEFTDAVNRLRLGTNAPVGERAMPDTTEMLPESKFKPRIQWLANRIPDGARVLDLGCGPGEVLHFLHRYKRADGLGLDRENEYLENCRRIGVRALYADFSNLDDTNLRYACGQRWDVVLILDTLFYWRNPAVVLAALADRCMKMYVTIGNTAHIKFRLKHLLGRQIFWPNTRGTPQGPVFSLEWDLHAWTYSGFIVWAGNLGYTVRPVARRSVNAAFKRLGLFPSLFARSVVYELVPR